MMRKREFSFYFIASSKIFFGGAGTQKKILRKTQDFKMAAQVGIEPTTN